MCVCGGVLCVCVCVCLCVLTTFCLSIHAWVDTGLLPPLAIVCYAAMNMGGQISL